MQSCDEVSCLRRDMECASRGRGCVRGARGQQRALQPGNGNVLRALAPNPAELPGLD